MSTTLARGVRATLVCCTVLLGCGLDSRNPGLATLGGGVEDGGAVPGFGDGGLGGGAPRLRLSAASVDLGPVALGFPARARLSVSNEGDAPMGAPDVSWADPSDADFAVVQNQCLKEVAPDEQCELRVQFVPSKAGPSSAALRVAGARAQAAIVPFSGLGLVASGLVVVPAAGSYEDFGEVVVGDTAEGVFSILNPSSEPSGALAFSLNQSAFVISPPVTPEAEPAPEAEPFAVAPGEPPCEPGASLPGGASCALRVGFTPSGRGPVEATLTAILDDVGGVSTTLLGEGVVAGLLAASTASVDFQGVIPGQAAQRSLAIENRGDEPLTLSGAALEPASGVFSILSGTCGTGVTLGAGASCSVALEFRPTDADAASAAELVVSALEGEQVQRIALAGQALKPGNMLISVAAPGEESFGDVLLGENLVRAFQVSNPGAQPSGVLGLVATNGFVVDPGTAEGDCTGETSLVNGQGCAVHVRFAPTERGAAAGVLTVSSDLAGATSLALSGNGIAPAALTVAAELNFGRLATGESGQKVVTVSNAGDQPLPPPTLEVASGNPAHAGAFSLESSCLAPLLFEESCEVTLTFAPTTASAHSATLDLAAEPGGRASVLLLGQAIVPGSLVLAAAADGGADFGDVALGASATSVFTLANPGGEPAGALTIRSDNPAFLASPGDCGAQDPAGLVDGAACTFEVTFTPADRKPAVARLLALSGTLGEVSVELRGRGRGPARLEATVARDLGQANLGQDPGPANLFTWTVNNTGDLPSGELAVMSTNGAEFEVSNDTCSGVELGARASCQMLIGFRPSQAGARSGSITVTDAATEARLTLALTGLGQRIAQPGESCVNATCAEGLCTAGKCCDRACDRTCQVCGDAGVCIDQVNQEACGNGNARCFGVDQCLLPAEAPCAADADCGGGLLCKACAAGGRQCTDAASCCGGCPAGLTCVAGSCGCAAGQTSCGGGLCIAENDPLACCPGTSTACPAGASLCSAAGRCVQCLADTDCAACEACSVGGVCEPIGRGQTGQPGRCPAAQPLCDGAGGCFGPACTVAGSPEGCGECSVCEDFACQPVAPGAPCPVGSGLCNAAGACVSCIDSSQCSACQTCVGGACQPLGRGQAEELGRCPLATDLCDGLGACFTPACITEGATAGCGDCNVCSSFACRPAAAQTACSVGSGVCNGAGSCVCALDSDCPTCRSCIGGACLPTQPGQQGNCAPGEVCDADQTCGAPPECSAAQPCPACNTCVGGTCQPLAEDAACDTGSGPGFCNADGACAQCFVDEQCGVCQRCEGNTCLLLARGDQGRCSQANGASLCDGSADGCFAPECPTEGLQEGCGGCEICRDFTCEVYELAFGAACDLDVGSDLDPPGFCRNDGVCAECVTDSECTAPQVCDAASQRCTDPS